MMVPKDVAINDHSYSLKIFVHLLYALCSEKLVQKVYALAATRNHVMETLPLRPVTLQRVNVFVAQLDSHRKGVILLVKFALKKSVCADQLQVAKGMLSTRIVTLKITSVYQVCPHINYDYLLFKSTYMIHLRFNITEIRCLFLC